MRRSTTGLIAGAGAAAAGLAALAWSRRRARRPGDPGTRPVPKVPPAPARDEGPGPLDPAVTRHQVTTNDGGSIHVVDHGEGPTVVLVHGVTLTSDIWLNQFDDLAATHRVIALDQRGHGRSTAGDGGYALTRMADDLLEVLDHLEVERVVLVGHSMGGMVSLTAATTRPERFAARVAGMVLVSTSGGPYPTAGRRVPAPLASGAVSVIGRQLARSEARGLGIVPVPRAAGMAARVAFGREPSAADVELTRRVMAPMSPTALAACIGAIAAHDVSTRLAAISVPARVVVGTRDLLTPPFHARRLAQGIAGAELVVLPGCGHMPMLERREELRDVIAGVAAAAR